MSLEQDLADVAYYRSRHGILVDTNLLIVLLVGATRPSLLKSLEVTSAYDADDVELISDLLGNNPRLIITPQVITEVSNLAGKIHGDDRVSFFGAFRALIKGSGERRLESSSIFEDDALEDPSNHPPSTPRVHGRPSARGSASRARA